MHARLVPQDGGPPVELVKDLTLVGRTEDCDLRLDHKSVSKHHCVLAVTDGLVLVRDLGSTNGTRVNGQRVRRGVLLPNDHVAIANFRYQVKFGPEAAAHTDRTTVDSQVGAAKDGANEAPSVTLNQPSRDEPDPSIRRNVLPDVYPDSPKKKP